MGMPQLPHPPAQLNPLTDVDVTLSGEPGRQKRDAVPIVLEAEHSVWALTLQLGRERPHDPKKIPWTSFAQIPYWDIRRKGSKQSPFATQEYESWINALAVDGPQQRQKDPLHSSTMEGINDEDNDVALQASL